jgi:hypothetical protein
MPIVRPFAFLKSVFSESDGTGSFARVSVGFIIFGVMSGILFLIFKNHALPDLSGPTAFVTTSSTTLYGVNKIVTVYQNTHNGDDTKTDNKT